MFRLVRLQGFWHAALLLCLALFGFAFVPEAAIYAQAITDQSIYTLQRGTPAAIPNFLDLVAGCNWAGIGGQIFNQDGLPMTGLIIKVSGALEDRQILQYVYTGSSQHFGPGGYDLKLADHPVSSLSLTLQLLDAAGEPLSLPFVLRTLDACEENLLVVNLTQVSLDNSVFLPIITR